MVASNISGKRARRDPAEVLGSTLQARKYDVDDKITYFEQNIRVCINCPTLAYTPWKNALVAGSWQPAVSIRMGMLSLGPLPRDEVIATLSVGIVIRS